MAYVIGSACVDCLDRSCRTECPVDCIYEGARKLYINPEECIDCGACEAACPVEAIAGADRVKTVDLPFVLDNAQFFSEILPGRDAPLASPGGAEAVGRVGVDTPMVAGLPLRAT
ncbi:ferredoxin [Rhodococcus opacus]|uniref:ferredoxin n=1 Tax=Rhodococcus opacus TaxID=37919 RepID=UPI002474BEAC|nr:ferredoxin [Rhodococcus opacus]MDH6288228.1 Fe-S-cluster-containing hydrogenase component 2 [Rhodococcus opacus]